MGADKTLLLSHHMRKPSREGRDANRHRASGSTDILAGADVTLAVERPASQETVVIETTKSRDVEECPPFAVSLWSGEGTEAPVELRFEGYGPIGGVSPGKVEQAGILIEQYLARCPERSARTDAIAAHTAAQGLSKTATERALAAGRTGGRLLNPARGLYVLPAG